MKIQHNINLKPYNTFHIDAIARYFVKITKKEDLLHICELKEFKNEKRLFLGGGSNILLTKDFDGIVILNQISGKKIIGQDNHSINLNIGGGENWIEFVNWACSNNYAGIENLSHIPGSVGASPIQNIGAYGVEAKDTIVSVGGINMKTKKYETYTNKQCNFEYRNSIFKTSLKGIFFITDVTFRLKKIKVDTNGHTLNYNPMISYGAINQIILDKKIIPQTITPQIVSDIITDIRKEKLPDRNNLGTAGSFFKNPIITKKELANIHLIDPNIISRDIDKNHVKISAGQLIEKCDLKGYKKGNVGTYEKHALVLINHGNSKGSDIIELAEFIQKTVYQKFGIAIEPEVNYI